MRGNAFDGEIEQPKADPPLAAFLAPSWTKIFSSNSLMTHEEAWSHPSLAIVTP